MKKNLVQLLATGFGLGYLPLAPGTFGSLPGVLLFFLFRHHSLIFLVITILVSVLGVGIATRAENIFGEKDSGKIVIDEIAGQLITYLFVPFSWIYLVIGFVLFRIFDIVKPFPARWAQDNLPGGLGVVADDLVAGLQAAILLWIIDLVLKMV